MTFRVLVRVDAGPGIGGGHVMRCIALTLELRRLGWQIEFACHPESLEAVPDLAAWDVTMVQGSPEQQFASLLDRGARFDLLVVDHYGLDASFEDGVRSLAGTIAVIDDMPGHRSHRADILIDGSPGRTEADWTDQCAATRILAGTDFALVRDAVTQAREPSLRRRSSTEPVSNILVSFGLSDSGNATAPAIAAARVAFPSSRIDVVIGRASAHRDCIQHIAEMHGAVVHVAPKNYIDLLVAADLAIGAGGVSALERACLGVPSVVVETAGNQHDGIEALKAERAIIFAGRTADLAGGWPNGILELDAALCAELSQRSAALIDGLGASRTADALDRQLGANAASGRLQS